MKRALDTVNEKMLEMLGLQPSIIGKPLAEALPELMQTSLMDLLQTVFTTGQTYHGPEAKLEIHRNGQLHTGYYNVSYKALWNTAGEIYGIINTAIEVTEQVLARKKLEEAEESLRGAIELAQLATWTVYPESGMVTYSDRLKEWGSATEDRHLFEDGFNSIPESDRERIRRATEWAMDPRSGGFYNEEHPIINPRTGQRRVIHAQTRTYFDPAGKAVKVVGTAQDITQQRELQLALEQQVQKRTEELGRSNEELAAINKELAESNQLLIHSNQNLQQFAYVASHDLQEPLRKIQSFGDILKNRYADQLGDGVTYLERMRMAASRMSVLIRDLLIFSRMSTRQEATDSVDLNGVVKTALNDLDLLIQETGAVVEVPSLPTIQGNQSQLGQLFQNLISNALKFRRADGTPAIRIGCQVIDHIDLPAQVKPTKLTGAYYAISVSDNGIGFDNRYVDRIFQVFQRLHTKTEYVGTGIGLAICEKVATNHGGAITAISPPGEGSTFCLYLPVSSDNLPPTVIRFS